jgi:ACS family glucarate transporter-like MFS transporter
MSAGLYTAVPYGLAVLLSIALGYVSDRMLSGGQLQQGGRRTMIVCSLLVSSVILLAPFVDNIWIILGLITVTLTGLSTAGAMNFALLNDLLAEPAHIGKSMSIVIVGGNSFGVLAPIITGFVVAGTGSFNWAFGIAGLLLVSGATIALTLTRTPIVPSAR